MKLVQILQMNQTRTRTQKAAPTSLLAWLLLAMLVACQLIELSEAGSGGRGKGNASRNKKRKAKRYIERSISVVAEPPPPAVPAGSSNQITNSVEVNPEISLDVAGEHNVEKPTTTTTSTTISGEPESSSPSEIELNVNLSDNDHDDPHDEPDESVNQLDQEDEEEPATQEEPAAAAAAEEEAAAKVDSDFEWLPAAAAAANQAPIYTYPAGQQWVHQLPVSPLPSQVLVVNPPAQQQQPQQQQTPDWLLDSVLSSQAALLNQQQHQMNWFQMMLFQMMQRMELAASRQPAAQTLLFPWPWMAGNPGPAWSAPAPQAPVAPTSPEVANWDRRAPEAVNWPAMLAPSINNNSIVNNNSNKEASPFKYSSPEPEVEPVDFKRQDSSPQPAESSPVFADDDETNDDKYFRPGLDGSTPSSSIDTDYYSSWRGPYSFRSAREGREEDFKPRLMTNEQFKELVEQYPKYGGNLYRSSEWTPVAPSGHWGGQLKDSSGLRNGQNRAVWPAYGGLEVPLEELAHDEMLHQDPRRAAGLELQHGERKLKTEEEVEDAMSFVDENNSVENLSASPIEDPSIENALPVEFDPSGTTTTTTNPAEAPN